MIPLILDGETTSFQKGNPSSRQNKLIMFGIDYKDKQSIFVDDYSPLQSIFDDRPLIVGFNLKFDLRWLRRYGIKFDDCKVWDCQLAEFLFSFQSKRMPSLDACCEEQGLPRKLDFIKTAFWDNGLCTSWASLDTLAEYLCGDLDSTKALFLNQVERFKNYPQMFKLFKLQCEDLLCLLDMEEAGLKYSPERIQQGEEKTKRRIEEIEKQLLEGYEDIPINFNSTDHVSCFLYGGTITVKKRMPVGIFKTGQRKGEIKTKLIEFPYDLPRIVNPIKGSELEKEGYWSTNDTYLRLLKGNKKTKEKIALLQELSKAQKLLTTYYQGIPKLAKKMDWEDEYIFGQYNQCVVATGRLSSSGPNQQNFGPEWKECLISRFEE